MTRKPRVNTPQNYVFGRPAKYDLIQEANDLIAWAKNDNSINLLQFTNTKPYSAVKLSDFAKENEYFGEALRKAHEIIGERQQRLANEGKLNYGDYQRRIHMHDPILHASERAEKAYEAELKKKAESHNINLLLSQLNELSSETE
jgi:hypothetical protein